MKISLENEIFHFLEIFKNPALSRLKIAGVLRLRLACADALSSNQ